MIKKPSAEQVIMEAFKKVGAYPDSGHGEIKIILHSHKVVCIKKEESIKLSD